MTEASKRSTSRVSNGNLKLILAMLAALGVPLGSGVVGYEALKADTAWQAKNLQALQVRHDSDMRLCEEKFNSLKSCLDRISTRSASSEAKLDMLVQMVRDMKGVRHE